jgi:hypothetical protein
MALGYGAGATHNSALVVGLSNTPTTSDRIGQFKVRAPGGMTFLSSNGTGGSFSPLVGVELAAGSGSWSTLSDRNAKHAFAPINTREVLRKVTALPLSSWNYKGNPSRHIGPMAQDFRAAFGLGLDERHIDSVDMDGVALAAIQGLNSELQTQLKERDTKIATLEAQLKEQNASLEMRLKRLEAGK